MILKDKFKSRITIYQARSGAIILVFATRHIVLNKEQVETLVGGSVYDIEDFDRVKYFKFYG